MNKTETILYMPIVLLAIFGIMSFQIPNTLSSINIFYIILLSIFLLNFLKINKRTIALVIIAGSYLCAAFIQLYFDLQAHLFDFITTYLLFIYLFILSFFAGKERLNPDRFKVFFRVIIILFFVKYFYSILFSLSHRPGLFTENNFDLLFLALLVINYYDLFRRFSLIEASLLVAIVVLSGSKSGVLSFIFIFIVFSFDRSFFKVKHLYLYLVLSLLVFLAIYVIQSRLPDGGLENIDRYRFFMVFLQEIQNWNWFNYMTGNPFMTELNNDSCNSLLYYDRLFSYKGDTSCYPVILHSFILRVVLEHGLLGLFFIIYSYVKLLHVSGHDKRTIIAVIGVLIVNSLSVSSFNSIFAVIGVLILLMMSKSQSIRRSSA